MRMANASQQHKSASQQHKSGQLVQSGLLILARKIFHSIRFSVGPICHNPEHPPAAGN